MRASANPLDVHEDHAVAWVILLLSVSVLLPPSAVAGPVQLDDVAPLLVGVFGVGLIAFSQALRPPLAVWGLLACGVGFAVSSWMSDYNVGLGLRSLARGAGRFWLYAVLVAMLHPLLRADTRRNSLAHILIIVSVLESVFCILAYALDYSGPSGVGMAPTPSWTDLRRVHGTFSPGTSGGGGTPVGSNFLGAYLAMTILVTAGSMLRARPRLQTSLLACAALLQFVALMLSFTRASVAALGVGVVLMLIGLGKRRLILPVMLPAVAVALSLPAWRERLFNLVSNRAALYRAGWDVSWNNPWFGVGEGHYYDALKSEALWAFTPAGEAVASPHNSFLLAAAYAGFPVAFLFLAVLLLVLVKAWKVALVATPQAKPLLVSFAAALTALFVQDQVNNLMFVPKIALCFWVLAAATQHEPASS